MTPTLDPSETHIAVSRQADAALAQLGVGPDLSFRDRRRSVVQAAYDGLEPMEDSREVHYLARATVAGTPVVLLCLAINGSAFGDKSSSTIIRGAYSPKRAAELSAVGRGLAPFQNELRSQSGRKWNDDSNDRTS